MRVLEVLRENNMNSNSAFEILELEFQRESWETLLVCAIWCAISAENFVCHLLTCVPFLPCR
jgi:hypothetical protein